MANSDRGPGSATRQADALRNEGVQVDEDSMGEFYVDFSRCGWFPDPEDYDAIESSDIEV